MNSGRTPAVPATSQRDSAAAYIDDTPAGLEVIRAIHEQVRFAEQLDGVGGRQIDDERSILRSAYEMKVPVFCPALPDSMIGLQAWMFSQTKKLTVDAFADIKEIVDICYEAEHSGIVIIGGGVPKNFALQSMLVTPKSFDLAIQLTTDTPENGGLSGATLSEAISWGKISAHAKYVTVYGDATITFPMMVAASMERLDKKKQESVDGLKSLKK